MHLAQVQYTDIIFTIIYMAIVGYLGWLGYRRTKSAADYLLAGRKAHPLIMALSYGATFISTSAIVGFGGVAGMFGMSLLWLTFANIFVGIFIAFVFLGGPARRIGHRLDAHTFPEWMGRRFESKGIQVFAGLIIFLFMPLYAAAVLIGGTEFVTTAFGMPYESSLMIFAVITAAYVFFGGLKGVLYTDTFQGVIMIFGMLALIIWAYSNVGGVAEGHQALTAMKDSVPGGLKAIGHQGWTAMPKFGFGWGGVDPSAGKPSPYDLWWIVVSSIVMGVGIGVLAQPQLVVRFLTVKSGKELNRALLYGGTFILLMTGVAFTVGAISNLYFKKYEKIDGKIIALIDNAQVITKKEPGRKDMTAPARLITIKSEKGEMTVIADGLGTKAKIVDAATGNAYALPSKASTTQPAAPAPWGDRDVSVYPSAVAFTRSLTNTGTIHAPVWELNPDSIIPTYIASAMPSWFKVLFLLTLLAAAMSTMSSQYHTLGTAIGHDVFAQLSKGTSPTSGRTIGVVRLGIVVGLILAVTIGWKMRGGYFIARATGIFFGLCAATFLPTFLGGLFWKRMTRTGAIWSMIVGFTVTLFWVVFVKNAEAGAIGLARRIIGEVKSAYPNSILYKYPNWPNVDPLVIALPLSILTAITVSLMTRPPSAEHLGKCQPKWADSVGSAPVAASAK